eukprot:394114_1
MQPSFITGKSIDKVDMKTQLTIFGYVRLIQNTLPETSQFYNIPTSITYFVLSYFWNPERFHCSSSNIEMSEDMMTINRIKIGFKDASWATSYGKIGIYSESDVHCYWKIKINKRVCPFFIGVAMHRNVDRAYAYNKSKETGLFYALYCNRGGTHSDHMGERNNYAVICNEGDIITMELNLKNREIKFSINDINYGTAFSSIEKRKNVTYYLAISLGNGKSHQMTIMDFGYYSVN